MIDKFLVGIVSFVGFIIFWRFVVEPSIIQVCHQQRMAEVLTKEEYKVKGRFEQ